jgi:hypothetical protein
MSSALGPFDRRVHRRRCLRCIRGHLKVTLSSDKALPWKADPKILSAKAASPVIAAFAHPGTALLLSYQSRQFDWTRLSTAAFSKNPDMIISVSSPKLHVRYCQIFLAATLRIYFRPLSVSITSREGLSMVSKMCARCSTARQLCTMPP